MRTVEHEKDNRLYEVIKTYIEENKISPTVAELSALMGVNSLATILNRLSRLEERGLIKRSSLPRSIHLVDHDDCADRLAEVYALILCFETARALDLIEQLTTPEQREFAIGRLEDEMFFGIERN